MLQHCDVNADLVQSYENDEEDDDTFDESADEAHALHLGVFCYSDADVVCECDACEEDDDGEKNVWEPHDERVHKV